MDKKYPHFPKLLKKLMSKKCVFVERDEVIPFHQFASYVVNVYAGAITLDGGRYLYIE